MAVENLFDRHTLTVRGFNPMQFADYVFQFFNIGHGFLSVLISNRTMKGDSLAGVSMLEILATWEDIFARKSMVPR
jgi:hypothetical protein